MAKVLVTGIGGFIGKHVARACLEAGHDVRGTVRDVKRGATLRQLLGPLAKGGSLTLMRADLLSDDGWADAMSGTDAVLHVASPFPMVAPKNAEDIIRPAVDGTLRVLRAAQAAGVARFVQTSSVVAVAYGHPRDKQSFSAADWSNLEDPHLGAYARSKTLAERAARDFIARQGGAMHYTSINPGLVLGPLMDQDSGTSVDLIRRFLKGSYPALPRLSIMTVDVRDVADMHVAAITREIASGGRYLAVAGAPQLVDLAKAIKAALGGAARRVPTRQLPDVVVRIASLFDASLKEALPLLGKTLSFDTQPAQRDLGITFISAEDAAAATARSLVQFGRIS